MRKAREVVNARKQLFDSLAGLEFLPTEQNQIPNDTYTELRKALELDTPTLASLKDRRTSIENQLIVVNEKLNKLPTLQNTLQKLTNDLSGIAI